MDWYYANRGSQVGPISRQDLLFKMQSGHIGPETFVWQPQFDNWKRAREVSGIGFNPSDHPAASRQAQPLEGRGLGIVVIAMLAVGAVLDLLIILLTTIMEGSGKAMDIANLISIPALLLYWITGGLFAAWAYRMHRNLKTFGTQGLRYTPAWAAGGFFIPFVNIVRPYQIFREIWKASDPAAGPATWQNRRVSILVTFWWIGFQAMALFGQIGFHLVMAEATDEVQLVVMVLTDLISIGTAALAAVVVFLTMRRQHRKAAVLAMIP